MSALIVANLLFVGESPRLFSGYHYAVLGTLLLCYIFMAHYKLLPSSQGFKDFMDTINSAGGHIVILSVFTYVAIRFAMHFIYWVISLPGDVITKQQAQIAVGIAFVTGSLFGTFSAALIKTMSGGKANGSTVPTTPPSSDNSAVAAPVPVPPTPGANHP